MGKLFGTDGIRGVVNKGLDAPTAYRVGLAVATVLGEAKARPLVAIGKDTRISCDMLEGALVAGLCSAGADVLHLGVIPTPAVAYLTIREGCDAGIVISASHNPCEHNGIKVFNSQGFKLSDELEARVEEIVLTDGAGVSHKTGGDIGRVIHADERASEHYIAHLAGTVDSDFAGLRLLVDCANGAASATAARLFARFPALHADLMSDTPDGVNINRDCGSTHLGGLAARVKAGGYDLGLAFDGDADRVLAIDETGEEIDGDQMMAVCGAALLAEGRLPGNTVVATVMSNIGLHMFARERGMNLLCTDVGDRNVLERMLQDGYAIGGEQSGHMIFLDYATTGDGQLSALQFLNRLYKSGKKASELAGICKKYPQFLINVPVADAAAKAAVMSSPVVLDCLREQERLLAGDGRVLLRPSGTEALIRVMVEGKDSIFAEECAKTLANTIKSL